jgi:hypothetical protein
MEVVDVRSWTWVHLAFATAIYWVVVVGSWWIYRTRPSQQAKARAAANQHVVPGTDGELHVYSAEINLVPVLAILFGPPLLLVLVWALF